MESLLSDSELIVRLDEAAANERTSLCATLRFLTEIERRELFVELGYRTMFDYCVLRLKMSEGAANRRIYAGRAAARFPVIYDRLAAGDLSLSSVSRLAPHLTTANIESLIARASGSRMRQIETLVAGLTFKEAAEVPQAAPKAASEELFLPASAPSSPVAPGESASAEKYVAASVSEPAPVIECRTVERRKDSISIESPEVLRFVFRAHPRLREKLEFAARLLGRRPDGRLETLLTILVEQFLDREDPNRRAAGKRRPSALRARRAARWVRDAVWRRDEGRCVYVAADGTRCSAMTKLEYDHIIPWAMGGKSDDPANIRLLCRPHNLLLARRTFGDRVPRGPRLS